MREIRPLRVMWRGLETGSRGITELPRQFPTLPLTPNGRRIPGLKLDHPRQLALMHALVGFSHVAAHDTFTVRELQPQATQALG